jgi:pimeloyl-ACP methyl ester carboxylesterase
MMRVSRRSILSRCAAAALMLPASWLAYPDTRASAQAAPRDGAITVDGRTIHYLDWGPEDRPALFMVHAFDRSAHSYDHVAPLLNQRHRVIAVDLRGHGDSDWSPNGAYAVEDYVTDLHALVLQLNLPSVSLIGCSIGGRVVQVYAGMHPDRVSKLIVLDVGFARPESTTRILSERIAREQEGWASEDELFASLRGAQARVPEDVHRRQVRYETKLLANGRIGWKYDPKIVNGMGPVELWDYVRHIKAPTLYIVGGRSRLVTAEEQKELRTLPFAEVVTIRDAGHYPQEDTPDVFLAIVKAFLAG